VALSMALVESSRMRMRGFEDSRGDTLDDHLGAVATAFAIDLPRFSHPSRIQEQNPSRKLPQYNDAGLGSNCPFAGLADEMRAVYSR
jgi:hypothetical protein